MRAPCATGDATPTRWALLVVAAWLSVTIVRSFDARFYVDDAAYYTTLGEALAQGRGFRNIDTLGEPVDHVTSFMCPLMVAALRRLGVPLAGLCAGGIALGAVFLWTTLKRFGSRFPAGLAPWIVLLAGLGSMHENALFPLSDLPAAAWILIGLSAVARYGEPGPLLGRAGILAGGMLLAAAWTRPAALVATAAACLWLFLDAPDHSARRRKALILGAVVALGWGLWAARGLQEERLNTTIYVKDMFYHKDPYHPESGRLGLADLATRLRTAVLRDQPVYLTRLAWIGGYPNPRPWVCFGFASLSALGFLWNLLKRRTVVEYFVALTALVLLLWHEVQPRHFIPVAPFLLAYAAWGALLVLESLPRPGTWLVGGFLAVAAILGTVDRLGRARPPSSEQTEVVQAARWLKDHASPEDVVLSQAPHCVYLYSGLKGIWAAGVWASRDPTYLPGVIREGKAQWLLENPYARSHEDLELRLAPFRGSFRECARFGKVQVFRVVAR